MAAKFAPSLDKGPLPLRPIREAARRALLEALDSVRGRKGLVLEGGFASPLSLVAEALALKEHGVEVFSVLDGQPSVVDTFVDRGVRQVVYLLHSRLDSMQAAVRHVQMCQGLRAGQFEFTMLLMPRRSAVCEQLLDEGGILADVTVRELPLDWVPLEEDLLSLEMPWAFKELAVDKDTSSLYYIARALTALQQATGTIPHIKGKGEAAQAVQRIMSRMRAEQGRDAPAAAAPGEGIDTLVLLDRSVDLVTPMCTQLTYEGLLHEVFGLTCGQLRMGEVASAGSSGAADALAPGQKVYGLNSGDAVFRETRDLFYLGARKWLNETLRCEAWTPDPDSSCGWPSSAKAGWETDPPSPALASSSTIQQFRDSGMHSADITQLRGFVAELKDKFTRIPLHTSLVERLATAFQSPAFVARQQVEAGLLDEGDEMPAIEDLMSQGEPLLPLLRLLVLYCAVHGGVPKRHFEALRRDLLNTYGHQHLLTLGALASAGLLQRREGRRSAFPAAKAALRLLLQEGQSLDESDPADIHFAFAGYAPLSVRLVQQALALGGGWSAPEAAPALASLPGPTFELQQTTDEAGLPVEKREAAPAAPSSSLAAGVAAVAALAGVGGGSSSAAGGEAAGKQQQLQQQTLTAEAMQKQQQDGGGGTSRRRTVLVLFIGGVTHAEIAALRFLSRKGLANADFVIAATSIVTGSSLLAPLVAASGEPGALPEVAVA